MKKLKNYFLLTILSAISLFFVGFSSWSISSKAIKDLNISSGEILDNNKYIKYKSSIDFFEFCSEGLIVNETISSSDKIAFGLILENIDDYVLIKNNNMLLLNLSLKSICLTDTSFNIFDYILINSGIYSITDDNNQLLYEHAISNVNNNSSQKTIEFSVEETDITKYKMNRLNFEFKFTFDFSSVISKFSTDIYPKISNNSITFDFQATIV